MITKSNFNKPPQKELLAPLRQQVLFYDILELDYDVLVYAALCYDVSVYNVLFCNASIYAALFCDVLFYDALCFSRYSLGLQPIICLKAPENLLPFS